jgi:hypothetical protein
MLAIVHRTRKGASKIIAVDYTFLHFMLVAGTRHTIKIIKVHLG